MGSAATGQEDRWSDIDLGFGVREAGHVVPVMSDFTALLYEQGAVHHYDLRAGEWTYRVFFVKGGLQVDLAFVEQDEFRALGPAFRLVLGEAKPAAFLPVQNPMDSVGMG